MFKKLKSYLENDTFFNSLLIVLVGVSAFGLGRWSILEEGRSAPTVPTGITFYNNPEPTSVTAKNTTNLISPKSEDVQKKVVASRGGSKYHFPECAGAKRIKPENLLEFASVDLARAAGYTPATNCPGLQ
jgi:hypothetical protein